MFKGLPALVIGTPLLYFLTKSFFFALFIAGLICLVWGLMELKAEPLEEEVPNGKNRISRQASRAIHR